MSEQRNPLVRLVETAVFAPVGLALLVREQVPKLAARGKSETETRVRVAKMVGEFAVKAGKKEVERRLAGRNRTEHPATASAATQAPQPASGPVSDAPADGVGTAATTEATASSATHVGITADETAPPVGDLAIPGYDSLAASQVVDRLASLTADELDAVRRYELRGRRRRTILNRIEQLTSS